MQPEEFMDWLNTVERIFDYKDVAEDHRVKLVAIKLKKHASIWWEHLNKQRKLSLNVEKQIKENRGGTSRSWLKEGNSNRAPTAIGKPASAPKTDAFSKPTRKQEVSLVEENEEEFNEEVGLNLDEGPRFDEELTYGDEGESLVIRRSLNAAQV
ncbi:unnamed protein product [Prunus brigantina]